MVTTKLWGRTGNQMFMIAAVIGYAQKHDLEYHIPPKTTNNNLWPPAFIHLYNRNYKPSKPTVKISEEGHAYQDIPFEENWRNLNIELSGYWQSEKYLEHCKEDVLKAFNIPYNFREGIVSIHVRRGDYLDPHHLDKHPVCSIQYLADAMRYMSNIGYKQFLVFSDDIDWCKHNLNNYHFFDYHFEYSEGLNPLGDIALMSSCEHQIISNSTFSLWASILNQNPDKICIAPKQWFGPGNNHLPSSDIYTKNSIII